MPNRRQFLKQSSQFATAIAMAGACTSTQQPRQVAASRPNVLFIAIDDLNDWIGCLGGHPDTRTPNIDRLAARGTTFTHAYCTAPACNPSRASLLTGIRPSTSGVYLNSQPWRPALPDATTIPGHFKDHGYYVAGRGKIFHGRHSKDTPAWHEYIPKGPDPQPDHRPLNGIPNTAHFDWGPIDVTDEEMDDTQVTKWAADFLEREHDRPFFLACGLFRPHLPWYAPRKYFDMYPPESVTLPNVNDNDLDDVPLSGRKMARTKTDHRRVVETDNWRRAVAAYLACIAYTDTNVGLLLNALDKSEYARNTIIVLWGDHGWHLGEKLHWRKFALWEEATRVPLIFSTPESRVAGMRCGRTVSLLDIYPTLSGLCNLSARSEWEGVSLQPLLKNPEAEWDRPALTTHGRNNHSVRSEQWRYIRYANGTEELYDHLNDPLEWTNLANRRRLRHVKEELAAWLPTINVPNAPGPK